MNSSKDDIFLYITVSVIILFISTAVINVRTGHLLALLISVIVIYGIYYYKLNNYVSFNKDMEFKLKTLIDNDHENNLEYLHIDANLIELFYSLHKDMNYNPGVLISAIRVTDNLLRIRHDMELKLCKTPGVRNYKLIEDKVCNSILENSYENFLVAEEQVSKCMNYLSAIIISLPVNPVLHQKYEKFMHRAHILLKRNLDIIKNIHENSGREITYRTRFITDYDLPKAFNKKQKYDFY